jgi:hypothetical protein
MTLVLRCKNQQAVKPPSVPLVNRCFALCLDRVRLWPIKPAASVTDLFYEILTATVRFPAVALGKFSVPCPRKSGQNWLLTSAQKMHNQHMGEVVSATTWHGWSSNKSFELVFMKLNFNYYDILGKIGKEAGLLKTLTRSCVGCISPGRNANCGPVRAITTLWPLINLSTTIRTACQHPAVVSIWITFIVHQHTAMYFYTGNNVLSTKPIELRQATRLDYDTDIFMAHTLKFEKC